MSLDVQLFYLLNNLAGQTPFFDGVVIFFASYLGYILLIALLALLALSQYPFREKLEIFFIAIASGVVARLGVTELIRYVYPRERPFSVLPVEQLITDTSLSSFPSGHATFFFALSTVVYLYNKKWGIGFFIATILITVSRVAAGIHYPSDIVGGALVGIVVASIIFFIARKILTPKVPESEITTY